MMLLALVDPSTSKHKRLMRRVYHSEVEFSFHQASSTRILYYQLMYMYISRVQTLCGTVIAIHGCIDGYVAY